MAAILIVDDNAVMSEALSEAARDLGHKVCVAPSGAAALALLDDQAVDAVLLDLRMPGMDGLEVLRRMRSRPRPPPVTILTAHATATNTIEAMRIGAFDHLTKPIGREALARALNGMLAALAEPRSSRREVPQDGLIGSSEAIRRVQKTIGVLADSIATVLITGETGTGKELVARAIHEHGHRAGKPFVAVNCAAIPAELIESELFGHVRGAFTGATADRRGAFREAEHGTLLLDEIGEMPAPTQAKLLRVLEDRKVRRLGSKTETPVDVRVVAATNKDPEQAVSSGHLRQDLYFRLNVFHINLPPLREHKEDIPLLAEHILRDINVKHSKTVKGVGAEVMDIFMSHTWPGNIRELRNVLERSAIMCERDLITRACLPGEFGKTQAKSPSDLGAIKFPIGTTVDAMERELILQTLAATGNNKTRAAELLGISLKTLHNKLKEYGGEKAEGE